jgi:hypothetical protein
MIAMPKMTTAEVARKTGNALNLIKEYAKIIQNLYKSPNSKIEILYARDLAAKIEECINYIQRGALMDGKDDNNTE